MSKNIRIDFNKNWMDDLSKEISKDIQKNGIEVSCPYCGKPVTVYSNTGTCPDCEKEFEEPKRCSISGEFWGAPFTEYYSGCPYCKSNDISEIRGRCDCNRFEV